MSETIHLDADDHESLAAFDATHTGTKTTYLDSNWRQVKKIYSDDGLTIIFDHKETK